ncbi:MAG: hypothetical protein JSU06_10040 [Actinobacteria bacterium]|nr:hypothetical protein [Actinomycetota bacterium]
MTAGPHEETDVQRIHIRSTVDGVDHDAATRWCLGEGLVGIGWGIWDGNGERTWERYVEGYENRHGAVDANVRRFHDLDVGTLIWTRERSGNYWLGRIEGRWRYRDDEVAQRLDLFNLRPTAWKEVGTEDRVPGRVVNAFRSRMTLQRIKDRGAVSYSNRLYRRSDTDEERVAVDPRAVIESLLGPEDLEDLVAVYLQDRFDYLLVSRFRSTPGYEYVLRKRDGGQTAVASVKSGDTPVDLDLLPVNTVDEAFAYAVSGKYTGERSPNTRCIETEELCDFMLGRRSILPDRITDWLER